MKIPSSIKHKHIDLVKGFVRGWFLAILAITVLPAQADQILQRELLYENSDNLSPADVTSLAFVTFDKSLNIGFEEKNIWLRLQVAPRPGENLHLIFTLPTLDKVSVFTKNNNQDVEWKETMLTPTEIIKSFALPIEKSAASSKNIEIYIKIHSEGVGTLGVNILPESEWLEYRINQTLWNAFQIGAACTLLIWSLVNLYQHPSRLHALLSFNFIIINLRLQMQSGELTNYLHLTIKETSVLMLFFLFFYGINTIFLIHSVINEAESRDKRKNLFLGSYLLVVCLITLNTITPRFPLIVSAFIIFGWLTGLTTWDFLKNIKSTVAPKEIMKVRWLFIFFLIVYFLFGFFKSLVPWLQIAPNLTYGHSFNISWMITGVLTIKILSLISQQKLIQSTLDAANAIKLANSETKRRLNQQRFLSMLMHEIRTPLSVIKISTDAISKLTNYSTETNVWGKRTDVAIQNITQVIENCIQVEKQEEGLIKPQIRAFHAKKELLDQISQISLTNSELASRLEVNFLIDDNIKLESDVNYIRSIFFNLISNALKYSPPDTPIRLTTLKVTHAHGNAIKVQVESSLDGLDKPDLNQLFQRYYRSESAKKYSGTGLGLWISQSLANQINSFIHVELTNNQTIIFHFCINIVNS